MEIGNGRKTEKQELRKSRISVKSKESQQKEKIEIIDNQKMKDVRKRRNSEKGIKQKKSTDKRFNKNLNLDQLGHVFFCFFFFNFFFY